jgi:hypothetical protein
MFSGLLKRVVGARNLACSQYFQPVNTRPPCFCADQRGLSRLVARLFRSLFFVLIYPTRVTREMSRKKRTVVVSWYQMVYCPWIVR